MFVADDSSQDGNGTGRMLVGLALVAAFVSLLGIAVVWSLTYGPLG